MYYEFSDEVTSIDISEISESFITAGYVGLSELEETAKAFSFSPNTVTLCREETHFRSAIEVFDDYFFVTLKVINANQETLGFDRIALYAKKNLLILVNISDDGFSLRDKFLNAVRHFSPQSITIERLLYSLLLSIIEGDARLLERKEFMLSELEKTMMKNPDESLNYAILSTKHQLLHLRNYYEQLLDIGEAFEENENELFEEGELKYFRLFLDKAVRLKDNVDMLRDTAVHLKEAYEAALELQLNKTMKIFTVFTVVFSPLSFIAGWFGMNFKTMPELSWKYGYAFAIVVSLLTAVSIILFFKKKKWIE